MCFHVGYCGWSIKSKSLLICIRNFMKYQPSLWKENTFACHVSGKLEKHWCHHVLKALRNMHILDTFDCNLKTNYQILITIGTNIFDTTCHQMTIQLHTSPNVCFCTIWGKHNQRNITFFIQCDMIAQLTFCSHFWHFGWHFIQLSIF